MKQKHPKIIIVCTVGPEDEINPEKPYRVAKFVSDECCGHAIAKYRFVTIPCTYHDAVQSAKELAGPLRGEWA